ncbi:MAG: extracellular solute-binding protein [Pseudomonadota bacterium]|nr:extracellular solute-binding protein [Pseudomonadota bacterium]
MRAETTLRRRGILAGLGAAMVARPGRAAPPTPKTPLSISIYDVAGALALIQQGFEDYRAANPAVVSRFVYTKAPAPELAGKLRAQAQAGRSDIDLVLTGSDGLAAGLDQNLWERLLPERASVFPDLDHMLQPAALKLNTAQGQGYGITVCYYPSGPLIEYLPEKVATPPASAEDLLAWAKANPNRFMYANPSNSGPGRTFMMGLPWLLGDKDPADPIAGWDKTWAYLQEIGLYIEYYPTGTAATMRELGEGSRDIIVSTTGWDINPRALGIVPKSAAIGVLRGFHWVSDADYMCVPKAIAPDRLPIVLDIMAFLLTPKIQAYTYDEGYLYPGPVLKDVPLSMAPQRSRDVIAEFGRPEYERLIADNPIELPLKPDRMVAAFRRWDQSVGAKK